MDELDSLQAANADPPAQASRSRTPRPERPSTRRRLLIVLLALLLNGALIAIGLAWPKTRLTSAEVGRAPGVCGDWDMRYGPHDQLGQGADGLSTVAVVAKNDVWAAGRVGNEPMLEHWDGRSWQFNLGPTTLDNVGANVHKLVTVAADNVWAIGSYYKNPSFANEWTFTLHWDGAAWSIVPSPNLGPQNDRLYYRDTLVGGAARAANDVWAVGSYQYDEAKWRTLVLHWDGRQWQIIESPNFDAGPDYETFASGLTDVVALAADDVWAVGNYSARRKFNGFYSGGPLAMHWDGKQWRLAALPNGPGRGESDLSSVSAINAHDIWAVGSGWYSAARTLHWDGTGWNWVATPFGEESDHPLSDVVALAANDVWAVGSSGASPSQTLVLHWNGSGWGVVESPSPLRNTVFSAVAADGPTELWMVGTTTDERSDSQLMLEPEYALAARFTRTLCPAGSPAGTR
jgi:hypothetical protein